MRKLRQFLCGLIGHGRVHERINHGPWVCTRCGGVNYKHNASGYCVLSSSHRKERFHD